MKNQDGATATAERPASAALVEIHRDELVGRRGLDARWVRANCRSVSEEEASQRLGYTAKSSGILLEGCGIQTQYKPDKPWKNEGDKKAPKYRSPSGDYDAMLPVCPDDPTYWTDLEALKAKCYEIDKHPCLLLTEGFLKAIAACSIGIPTIALLGIEMGLSPKDDDPQGRRYLVETLEVFARAGFGFIITFDSDSLTNPAVLQAQRKLGRQLSKFNIPVYSGTGLWLPEQGKGMDDYIQLNGGDKFKHEILGKVVDFQSWEQQFAAETDNPRRPPKAAAMAHELAEKYQQSLAWHDKEQSWYCYESEAPGIWSEESEVVVGATILAHLEATIGQNFGSAYLFDVLKILKHKLLRRRWDERGDLIPLIDGVLHKDTLELLPHSPNHNLTWSLPIRWSDRAIGCDPIKSWMLEIMQGDRTLVEVLRALLNCVIFGRANYQRYLEAIGPGGTGKGTFFRLASALVGDRNVFPSTLKSLEENRFELAAAAKAKLIVITEAEKYAGEVNVLKALTGEDKNRIEVKGRQQKCGDGFTFKGFVMLSANEPCQNADYTSGLERRRLSVPFSVQTPAELRRDLDEEFQPYLAGLLEWVLTMPQTEVRSLVVNTNKSVPALAKVRGEALCDANPLADWLDNNLVLDPTEKTYVGLDNPERAATWLYANYTSFMRQTNGRPIGQRRYTKLLEDLCCNQLKFPEVKRGRDRHGSYFEGLRIRTDSDKAPRPITGLEIEPPPPPDDPPRGDGLVTGCDGSVTTETLGSDGCDGCDASFPLNEDEKIELNAATESEIKTEMQNFGEIPDLEPNSITVAETPNNQPSQPSHPSITTHRNPSHPSQDDPLHGWEERNARKPFPNRKSDNIQSSRKRSLAIRQGILEARCLGDLAKLKAENGGEYSHAEVRWAVNWLKETQPIAHRHYEGCLKISQPELLPGL